MLIRAKLSQGGHYYGGIVKRLAQSETVSNQVIFPGALNSFFYGKNWKEEYRTSNVQHRMLNEKDSGWISSINLQKVSK